MGILSDIKDLKCDADLTVEEVKAMDEYKDLNEDDIAEVIETIRIFTEIVYEIHISKKQGETQKNIASHSAGDSFLYQYHKTAA
jgi:predicted  nucleic acid-binding Zn-ribbon protein